MSFLADTNGLTEQRKEPRAARGVREWFDSSDDGELNTSVLAPGGIRLGIEAVRGRDPSGAAGALVRGVALVTRNAREIARTGVLIVNPFSE